ncbi:lycopene cyclase family protein [Pelagibacteraceae bacterium]|nr:lycopene cyclase family protein [Pelagibacteraceae bacterium]
MKEFDYIIIGGGCAGLSLAYELEINNKLKEKTLAIIETRDEYKRDKTWSFWKVFDHNFEDCVIKSWNNFTINSSEGFHELMNKSFPYQSINSEKFYKKINSKLSLNPNVSCFKRLNEINSENSLIFNSVFEDKLDKSKLWQHFQGIEIETSNDIFDDEIVNLMDFNCDQKNDVHFFYTLPFSKNTALIETTWLSDLEDPSLMNYDLQLENYIKNNLGIKNYKINFIEKGAIPLFYPNFKNDGKTINIGSAGGMTRLSTGYTFLNIQEHSKYIVKNIDIIENTKKRNEEIENELVEAEKKYNSINLNLKEILAKLSHLKEDKARNEATVEGIENRKKDLLHSVENELNINDEASILPQSDLNNISPNNLPSLVEQSQKVEKIKKLRDSLGSVNLRADEETRKYETEIKKMEDDRTDLFSAILKLKSSIDELNQKGRERLLEAFTKVNRKFNEVYTKLFNGGTAKIELVDSDDPLEAGLEMYVSPPGKRLQSISLLSGGEQALTAMSLVFAVFLVNPSPICVLDEVDAPLDDANVTRFCSLLDELTKITKTKFIIITHHALTMSRMHRLYGVTMAEQGVSQLVSVDLQKAEELVA